MTDAQLKLKNALDSFRDVVWAIKNAAENVDEIEFNTDHFDQGMHSGLNVINELEDELDDLEKS